MVRHLVATAASGILLRASSIPFKQWECWREVRARCESIYRLGQSSLSLSPPPAISSKHRKRHLILWLFECLLACCPDLSDRDRREVKERILSSPTLRVAILRSPSEIHVREATRHLAHSYTFPGMPWFDDGIDDKDESAYEEAYHSADAEERHAFATGLRMKTTVVYRLVLQRKVPVGDIAIVERGATQVFAWPLHRRLERVPLGHSAPRTPRVNR